VSDVSDHGPAVESRAESRPELRPQARAGSRAESDEVLVVLSQDGDRSAFEELVRRTARLVFSRLYLDVGGDGHRAEDLVQETFLAAWRSVRQVTDPGGFRPWLLTVARTVMLDALRRESRQKRGGGGGGGAGGNHSPARRTDYSQMARHLHSGDPGPAEVAEQEDERRRVLSLLRDLPEEYRLPITLRYIAGADYDSIGRQLGLSNGSLRGLLSRGMTKLREAMKGSGGAETS
jgi:RNA polymerase sigma-70 factor (ECF subfamily)